MKIHKWKKHSKEYLATLLDYLKQDNANIFYKTEFIHQFAFSIAHNVDINPKVSPIELMQIIEDILSNNNVIDLSHFEELLKDISPRQKIEMSALYRWHFKKDIFKLTEHIWPIRSTIEFTSYEEEKEFLDSSANYYNHELNMDIKDYFNNGNIIRVTGFAHNLPDLISEIEEYRSILNFVFMRNKMILQTNEKQLSKILTSKICLKKSSNGKPSDYSYTPYSFRFEDFSNPLGISDTAIIDTFKEIHSIRAEKVRRKFIDLLTTYSEACDNYSNISSFIIFWSLIDNSLKNSRNKVKLLQSLYSQTVLNFSRVQILYDKRNKVIHEANYNIISRDDVLFLKIMVDKLLEFFLKYAKFIQNPENFPDLLSIYGNKRYHEDFMKQILAQNDDF
jgi:antitoxin component YwqK of YwqJK toxin-antitoxin module